MKRPIAIANPWCLVMDDSSSFRRSISVWMLRSRTASRLGVSAGWDFVEWMFKRASAG